MTIKHENIFAHTFTAEEVKQMLEVWDLERKKCLDDFSQIENPTKEQFAMLDLMQEQDICTRWILMKYIKAIKQ